MVWYVMEGMPISEQQRALVILSNLSKDFGGLWKLFYWCTETAAVLVARILLHRQYATIIVRKGKRATRAEFLSALREAASRPGVEVVDVFFHLHGLPCTFCFHEANAPSATLRDEIRALGLPENRLRLFYNTGCYGDSQNNDDMLAAGFVTAVGSKKMNATGAGEFPVFCGLWSFGRSIPNILRAADSTPLRTVQDAIARVLLPASRRGEVDSQKIIRGRQELRISSSV